MRVVFLFPELSPVIFRCFETDGRKISLPRKPGSCPSWPGAGPRPAAALRPAVLDGVELGLLFQLWGGACPACGHANTALVSKVWEAEIKVLWLWNELRGLTHKEMEAGARPPHCPLELTPNSSEDQERLRHDPQGRRGHPAGYREDPLSSLLFLVLLPQSVPESQRPVFPRRATQQTHSEIQSQQGHAGSHAFSQV